MDRKPAPTIFDIAAIQRQKDEPSSAISGVTVYPNPAYFSLNVNWSKEIQPQIIKIFNIDGKEMYSQVIETETLSELTIVTTEFPVGIYFVQVQSLNSIETRKVVIVKYNILLKERVA